MKIAMIGSGEYLPPIEPVDRFLLEQLGETRRVVCLPTAAGSEGAQRIDYWFNLGVEHFSRLGAEVQSLLVIDRASAEDEYLAGQIRQSNFVYLSGGNPNYLFKALQGSRAWQAIQDVLAGGGILAGCSAGAMVMGELIPGFPRSNKAFNFLSGAVILPHFDEIPQRLIQAAKPFIAQKKTLVGIEGSTALVELDGCYEVVGLGGVTIWDQRQKIRYMQGDRVNWQNDTRPHIYNP